LIHVYLIYVFTNNLFAYRKGQDTSHQQNKKTPDGKTEAESVKWELKTRQGYWAIHRISKMKAGAEKKPEEET
jgi:hypothetical protein